MLFDLVSEQDLSCDPRTKNYIYRMIETLLPRACEPATGKKPHLLLMELWADRPRPCWITLCEN